jgi:hypothetical protein
LDPEDMKYDEPYMLKSLAHYLSKEVENNDEMAVDVDMSGDAKALFDKEVKPKLEKMGYVFEENIDEYGDMDLDHEDDVPHDRDTIPGNKGLNFKDEVTYHPNESQDLRQLLKRAGLK